eukprot:scaffold3325_cov213-Alexandrium_tamarense.AAC.3
MLIWDVDEKNEDEIYEIGFCACTHYLCGKYRSRRKAHHARQFRLPTVLPPVDWTAHDLIQRRIVSLREC